MEPTPTAPATIGPYRLEREIARGGMGIVYLARDVRLDRAVAIKALPDDVASDPERLARFEREARVLASLNHPNIAGIYGLEESGGRRYLALEHVEGETLAERLTRGPVPLREALDLCVQIAAGIEAAHEGGVIHRDLKPGNVMITPGDQVKVVDFGLAKGRVAADSGLIDSPAVPGSAGRELSPTVPRSHGFPTSPTFPQSPVIPQSPTLAHSPTLGSPATMPGVILGTAAYLSPEQARGKPVDRRTDIWSFGCVLYECLTARMAFEGGTVSDTIAKILEREIDWGRLPRTTPPEVRDLLHRCLEKDPRKRLRDIGDARLSLEEVRAGAPGGGATAAATEGGVAGPRTSRRRRAIAIGAGLLFGAAGGLGMGILLDRWGPGDGREVTRLSIPLPSDLRVTQTSLTPDGRSFVALAAPRSSVKGAEPRSRIYVRRLDRSEFKVLPGTEGVAGFTVSPDGRWVGFIAPVSERTTQRHFQKVLVDGSAPPVPIVNVPDEWQGAPAWLRSGDLLFPTSNGREFIRVSSAGGTASKPQRFDVPGFEGSMNFGDPLPGDRGVLLRATSYEGGLYRISISVLDLKSGKAKMLVRDAGSPQYASTGHLLFTRRDALLAARFDLARLAVTGEPAAILGGLRVGTSWGNAGVQLTESGTLLHLTGGNVALDRHAIVVDANGKASEWSAERQPYEATLAPSPDGGRFAAVIANAGAIYEIWVSERNRPASRRVVAVPGVDCAVPVWSPDGARLAYSHVAQSSEDGVYTTSAGGTGTPRRILRGSADTTLFPSSWSPDGSQILCTRIRSGRADLVLTPAAPATEAEPAAIFGSDAQRGGGVFSPDGRLIAYTSDETGKGEVFVCGWDGSGPTGPPLLVSAGFVAAGPSTLCWGSGGRMLYYATDQEKLMAVSIDREPRLSASTPSEAWDLSALRVVRGLCGVLPDGRLLAIRKGQGEDEITRYDVALHFPEELKQRLKSARK